MKKSRLDSHPTCKLISELKNLAALVFSSVNQELAALRHYAETQNRLFEEEIRALKTDTADRDNLVSRFCEKKINELKSMSDLRHAQAKAFSIKLAEELKRHLQNYIENNNIVEQKIGTLTQSIEAAAEELDRALSSALQNGLEKNDQRVSNLEAALRGLEEVCELRLNGNAQNLKRGLKALQEFTTSRLQLVEERFTAQDQDIAGLQEAVNEEFSALHDRKEDLVEAMEALGGELESNWQRVDQQIGLLESRLAVLLSDEAALRENDSQRTLDQISKLKELFRKHTEGQEEQIKGLMGLQKSALQELDRALNARIEICASDMRATGEQFKETLDHARDFLSESQKLEQSVSTLRNRLNVLQRNGLKGFKALQTYMNLALGSNSKQLAALTAQQSSLNGSWQAEAVSLKEAIDVINKQTQVLETNKLDVNAAKVLEERCDRAVETFKLENNKIRAEFVGLFKNKIEDFDAFVQDRFTENNQPNK